MPDARDHSIAGRNALEAELTGVVLRAVRVFLAGVEKDAAEALTSPVVLASGLHLPSPLTLGKVVGRWSKTVGVIVGALSTGPVHLSEAYLGRVTQRLLASDLPGQVYTSARDVLSTAVEAGWDQRVTLRKLTAVLSVSTGAAQQTAPGEVTSHGVNWEAVARMHARTEATAAWNVDELGQLVRSGVGTKTWVAILDDRTRSDHAEADGQTVSVDQPFEVGGELLMYPGDPAGSEAQIANCRCSLFGGDEV